MLFHLLLLALGTAIAEAQNPTTWWQTTFISEERQLSSSTQYGTVSIHPVETVSIFEYFSSFLANSTTTADRTVTIPTVITHTLPVTTTTRRSTTTLVSTSVVTKDLWVVTATARPAIATVALSATVCANGASPAQTVTEYTGTYSPFPGQVTVLPSLWPIIVTTFASWTFTYRTIVGLGKEVTQINTAIISVWLSTKTEVQSSVTTVLRSFTDTTYLSTTTETLSTEWQLSYTTKPAPSACPSTITVTREARCAPTNLVAERDKHGLTPLELSDWVVADTKAQFPDGLFGNPTMDASACCQLCLDNPGCAASEWFRYELGNTSACRVYYRPGNETCGGGVPLSYVAYWNLPRQGSFLQTGCGQLKYEGCNNSCDS